MAFRPWAAVFQASRASSCSMAANAQASQSSSGRVQRTWAFLLCRCLIIRPRRGRGGARRPRPRSRPPPSRTARRWSRAGQSSPMRLVPVGMGGRPAPEEGKRPHRATPPPCVQVALQRGARCTVGGSSWVGRLSARPQRRQVRHPEAGARIRRAGPVQVVRSSPRRHLIAAPASTTVGARTSAARDHRRLTTTSPPPA